ncbi:winged helix-turn-helix domain-containing protein [Pseudoalteromonas sp. McH1-7]|uniref:winged helix-turn-helix domain-containing protein n=1 Tax=Pseudoalteromonas TaxID=53246 RepID=UPI00158FE02D|nr:MULTISPECIES: winged helix-turn-helix domain-containing protein [Pseudoalteromonas]MDW7547430.1 winged helix-turn-helix domain-containing protein [Pseudoalteromonas peptidolytica]NUZ09869.1 winged helix-turn-helix domain-containing protein [Pseudoalteromonas sp. McH1-7]
MKFAFKDFLFDSKELKLYKDDRKLNLKQKPAQILELFLSAPQTIHSKEDILEKVWPDRKVTDQVVFQNIGHLRALFGDDAIKTFSRKGYQWQIPCSAFDGTVEPESQPKTTETSEPASDVSESADTPKNQHDSQVDTITAAKPSNKLPLYVAATVAIVALVAYFALI